MIGPSSVLSSLTGNVTIFGAYSQCVAETSQMGMLQIDLPPKTWKGNTENNQPFVGPLAANFEPSPNLDIKGRRTSKSILFHAAKKLCPTQDGGIGEVKKCTAGPIFGLSSVDQTWQRKI